MKKKFLTTVILLNTLLGYAQQDNKPRWTHIPIDPVLPGSSWGTGGPALADYDGDGDIDIVSKIWNADGGIYHLDYWRNELKKNSMFSIRARLNGCNG